MRRLSRPIALNVALTVALATSSAFASGGVVDHAAAGDDAGVALLALDSLEVVATLGDTHMAVTETRHYAGVQPVMVFETFDAFPVTLYRSLAGSDEVAVNEVLVGGEPWAFEVLAPNDADARRRELVATLGAPGPLADLGTPLVVLEPIMVAPWAAPPAVTFELVQGLTARGTLEGSSLPIDWHKQPVGSVNVEVTATSEETLRALYSPYHPLTVNRVSDHQAVGTYSGYDRCTAFDLTVLRSTGDEPFHLDLLPYRYSDADGGYFMALVTPPSEVPEGAVTPRDIVIALDRSGSMEGEKIQQARDALSAVLAGLRPEDRFAIVTFAGGVETFSHDAVLADALAVAEAQGFVADVIADGGTNIYDALDTSFDALPITTGQPRYIVMLTDGQATKGETDTDAILAMAETRNEIGARIFTLGIGHDVNTILLDQLASQSAGDALYIAPGASVVTAVEAFFAQIADPVLTDPMLELSAVGATDVYPAVLQDLFAGQTQTIVGRYPMGTDTVTISLEGGAGAGGSQDHHFEVSLPAFDVAEGYVPRIWATRHIGTLLQEAKLGTAGESLVDDVLAIANRFGVVTEFTYFAVDEHGDAHMTYSEVPVDAVGSTAVATSSSLDAYQKGGTVGDAIDTWIRYVWDRTFPKQGGWFTDTSLSSLAPLPEVVDLQFASDAYFEAALAEADLGLGEFLAVDSNVRFEHLGRVFRVTDAATWTPDAEPPTPSASVPPPAALPTASLPTVDYLGDLAPVDSEPSEGAGGATDEAPPVGGLDGPKELTDTSGTPSAGCNSAAPGPGGAVVALLFLILCLGVPRRRWLRG